MFSHIVVGANDIAVSKRFYDATLGALGIPPSVVDDLGRVVYVTLAGIFVVGIPLNGESVIEANGLTIAFAAGSSEQVHAWHDAGLANHGITCEDPPGRRESNYGAMYVAYLRDPAGNKLCVVHRVPAGA